MCIGEVPMKGSSGNEPHEPELMSDQKPVLFSEP
jgi:hypothetical protein